MNIVCTIFAKTLAIVCTLCYNEFRKKKGWCGVVNQQQKWSVIHESDDDNGNPTLRAIKAEERKFFWIELNHKGSYAVINHDAKTVLKECKSLASAKRRVTMYLL